MELTLILSAFVTLFVVIDPIGLAPLFATLTAGMPAKQRNSIARRASLTALFLLLLFGLLGEAVLGFVGISMPAFRIAGGILLFLTALDMLFERRTKRREDQAHSHDDTTQDDLSIFPLATPLIAGPGAIATIILLTGQQSDWVGVGIMLAVMTAVLVIVYAMFLTAPLLERALGDTGINVVSRLLGMLLAALSVQFVLDGLSSFGLASGVSG